MTKNESDDSAYNAREEPVSTPSLNEGVPPDPRFIRVLSAVEITIGVVLFALIVVGVMWQVLGRYVPAVGWVGAGELALMSLVALTFITTGYLVGRNGHIVIEVFDQALAGRKLFVALRVISAVLMVVTCLALAYEAFVKIDTEWARSPMDALRKLAEATYIHHTTHKEFIQLVSIENIHRAEHLLQSPTILRENVTAITVLEEVIHRGVGEGVFRADVDALDVHMIISAYACFHVANRHTFAAIFDRDLLDPALQEPHRRLIGDMIVATMTAERADISSP